MVDDEAEALSLGTPAFASSSERLTDFLIPVLRDLSTP